MIWLTKMDLCEQSFENVTRTHTAVSPTRYICFRFMPPQRHLRCVGFNSHIRNSYNFFTKHYCKTNLYVITSELQCHVLGRNSITFTQYNYTSFCPSHYQGWTFYDCFQIVLWRIVISNHFRDTTRWQQFTRETGTALDTDTGNTVLQSQNDIFCVLLSHYPITV